MKRRFLAILLCVSMCLAISGCGSEKAEETSSSERAASVSNGTLKPDSSVVAVGKTTVTYNEYQTYYYYMKNQYESLLGSEVWQYNKAVGQNNTIGQEAIESVLRLIIQVKVICKEAAIEKVTLGTDEKEEADYKAKTAYTALSDRDREANGIDLKTLTRIFEENKLVQKMYNVEIAKVKADLTPEQMKAAKVQLIYCAAGEKNRAEVKTKIDRIRQSLNTGQTSFYTVAKANTELDEIECVVGNSDTRTNLAKAVLSLKQGQISNVVEEKDGYYIAFCLQPDSAALEQEYRNQVLQDKQIEAFQNAYKIWSEKFEVKVSKALLSDN